VCLGHRYLPDDEGPDQSGHCPGRSRRCTVSPDIRPGAFYSSWAGNRNRRAGRSARLTATPRGGPTSCRELPRNTVDAAAPTTSEHPGFPGTICLKAHRHIGLQALSGDIPGRGMLFAFAFPPGAATATEASKRRKQSWLLATTHTARRWPLKG